MPSLASDLLTLASVVVLVVVMIWAVRARRRSHGAHLDEVAGEEVCLHLKPAYDLLRSRGHRVVNVGQRNEELPLEIHLAPRFDPKLIADELKLEEPVFLSE